MALLIDTGVMVYTAGNGISTIPHGRTAVVRGQFVVRPLKRDNYLGVSSIKVHNIYLNTQLRIIDINSEEIDEGKIM